MKKEFDFFDKSYFETHNEAHINFYYTGHGKVGGIFLADFNIKYDEAVKNILVSANDQIKKIGKPYKNYHDYYESRWYVNWYIDACHSGSCKDETEKWMHEQMDCNLSEDWGKKIIKDDGKGGKVEKRSDNYSECSLYYLDRDALLFFKIFMSCSGSQLS